MTVMSGWKSGRGSYFHRLIISYSVLSVVLIGLCGFLLLHRIDGLMVQEIASDERYQLQSAREQLENRQLDKYRSVLLNQALSTIRSTSVEDIQFFLDAGKENNYFRITRLVNDLSTLSFAVPGLDNITLYFKNSGFMTDQHYYYERLEQAPNYSLVSVMDGVPSHQWFARVTKAGDGSTKRLLSYVYTLPYKSQGDHVKGYMIVDVDAKFLDETLRKGQGSPQQRLFVFDGKGQWLAGSGAPEAPDSTLLQEWLREDGAVTQVVDRPDGRRIVSLSAASDSQFGWRYATIRPIQSLELATGRMKEQLLLVCLIVLSLGFLASYLLSVGFYSPIKRLLLRVRNSQVPGAMETTGNEFAFIDGVVQTIDRIAIHMNGQLREKQIQDLLAGRSAFGEELVAIPLDRRYAVMSIQVRQGPDESKTLLRQLAGYRSLRVQTEAAQMSERELVLLLLAPIGEPEPDSEECLEDWQSWMRRHVVDCRYAAGFGPWVETPEAIHQSYEEAKEARKYVYLLGENMAVTSHQAARRSRFSGTQAAFDALDNRLRSADLDGCRSWMESLAAELREGSESWDSVELTLRQLALLISRVMIELDIPSSAKAAQSLELPTLTETIEELGRLCALVTDSVRVRQTGSHATMAHKLKSYIDEHLDHDLSLDQLSELTSYSKQFICKIFRESLNTTFSDYVTMRRLERAAEWLKETELPVSEVSVRCGYRSIQYFCTKFKAKYGVTPMQYRQSHAIRPGTDAVSGSE